MRKMANYVNCKLRRTPRTYDVCLFVHSDHRLAYEECYRATTFCHCTELQEFKGQCYDAIYHQ